MNIASLNLLPNTNFQNFRSINKISETSFCAGIKKNEISFTKLADAQKAQILAFSEQKNKQKLLKDLVQHIRNIASKENIEKMKKFHKETLDKKNQYEFADLDLGVSAKSIKVTMCKNAPFWMTIKNDDFGTVTEIQLRENGPFFARIELNKKYGNKKVMINFDSKGDVMWIDYGIKDIPNGFTIEEIYEQDKTGKFILSEENVTYDHDSLMKEFKKLPI